MNGLAAAGVLIVVVTACADRAPADGPGTPDTLVTEPADTAPPEPMVMPDMPEPERGRLVTASAGRDTLSGSWPVRAGRCAAPPSVQIISETGRVGTMLLLMLPDSGPEATAYPIRRPDTLLEAGAARLAVQLFGERRPAAYEVREGTVTIVQINGRVSGRFAATLRNVTTRDSAFYVGVFHRVALDSLSPDLCPAAADSAAADSSAADSSAADSIVGG